MASKYRILIEHNHLAVSTKEMRGFGSKVYDEMNGASQRYIDYLDFLTV